jgi:hypothetical protein
MDGQQLLDKINNQLVEAGCKLEVYAIGPANIPVPIQALLPVGFRAFINIVPNGKLNGNSSVYGQQGPKDRADAGSN